MGYAIAYFRDFVKPAKSFRAADEVEAEAFAKLDAALAALTGDATPEAIQDAALDVARVIPRYPEPAGQGRDAGAAGRSARWWKAIYQVLFGEDQGPASAPSRRSTGWPTPGR